jgi:hypothetical protein
VAHLASLEYWFTMTIEACRDATSTRNAAACLRALLETLARSTASLRAADWNDEASCGGGPTAESDGR